MEVGRHLLYSSLTKRTGLLEVMTKIVDEDAPLLLTCAFYMACHKEALYHCG